MPEILNCTRARPSSVHNLVVAATRLGEQATAERIQGLIYVEQQDPSHWRDNLEAAKCLGFIADRDGEILATAGALTWSTGYPRAIRQALAEAEADGTDDAIIYRAYRAALGCQLGENGSVPEDALVNAVLSAEGVGEFNTTKANTWREWMLAAGLGHTLGSAFSPVPVRALAELCEAHHGAEFTIIEFLKLAEAEFPVDLAPAERVPGELPVGVAVALIALRDDGILALSLKDDALHRRKLPIDHPDVSHVQICGEGGAT